MNGHNRSNCLHCIYLVGEMMMGARHCQPSFWIYVIQLTTLFFFLFFSFFCSFQWITNKIVKVIYIWMVIQRRSYKSILHWLEYTWTIGWIILDLLCKPNNAFYYIFHFSTLQKMEELKRKWNYPRWTFFDFFSFSRLHRKTIQMEWMER